MLFFFENENDVTVNRESIEIFSGLRPKSKIFVKKPTKMCQLKYNIRTEIHELDAVIYERVLQLLMDVWKPVYVLVVEI